MDYAEQGPRELIDDIPWSRANKVVEGLWVGSLSSACSVRFLAEKKISAVLSVCNERVTAQDPSLRLRHYRIRVEDSPQEDLLLHLPRACMFIATALAQGLNVLVHSEKGQNRAPAVVVAYLMQAFGLSATKALERVREAHEPMWMSPAFHEQLVLFEVCRFAPGPGNSSYDAWRAHVTHI